MGHPKVDGSKVGVGARGSENVDPGPYLNVPLPHSVGQGLWGRGGAR